MTQHTDLIDRLRCFDRVTCNEAANALEAQAREIAGLQAARRAYASEFPPDGEGEPDVGSIHQNIRAMKAEVEGLRKDAERYAWLRDKAQYHGGTRPVAWLTRSNGDGTPDSHLTWLDYEDLDEAIDEAMKGQP